MLASKIKNNNNLSIEINKILVYKHQLFSLNRF